MNMEKRVIGLGGVFFKAKDPETLRAWYSRHLGIHSEEWGAVFRFTEEEARGRLGYNVWSPFKENTTYFAPSEKDFMINYRVADLRTLMEILRTEGIEGVGEIDESDFGKFAWIVDPEGNKIELWEPPAEG